jgi:dolichol kinase
LVTKPTLCVGFGLSLASIIGKQSGRLIRLL